jgi:CubicO group peptidase (beta-lactamase class C family)
MTEIDRDVAFEVARYLDEWLAFRQRYLRVPGIQAAFLLRDEVLLSGAYGLADVEREIPLTTGHLFRIASHSKTFTATAVLQLVEAGRLRLDDRADAWVDYLAGAPLGGVTVGELLAHSGGLTRDGVDGDHWQLFRGFPDEAVLREIALAAGSSVLPANERFKYSNIGFSLLGAIIEQASGASYGQYVQEHIVDALGLRDTGPEYEPSRAHDYASGYSAFAYADKRVPIEHVDTRAMASATGFYSTAGDVVRYFSAHFLSDERLLTDASKRRMQQALWDTGVDNRSYGLGLAISTLRGRTVIGHGGGYPGHITSTMADPQAKFAVSVLTNAIDGPAEECVLAAIHLLDLALEGPGANPALSRFTGRFADLWGVIDIAVLGGRLWMLRPTLGDPADKATPLELVDETTLRIAGGNGFGSYGEPVSYDFRDDGTIRSIRADSGILHMPLDEFGLPDRVRLPGD